MQEEGADILAKLLVGLMESVVDRVEAWIEGLVEWAMRLVETEAIGSHENRLKGE